MPGYCPRGKLAVAAAVLREGLPDTGTLNLGETMNLRNTLIAVGNRFPTGPASKLTRRSWLTQPARAIANRLLPREPTMVTVRSGSVEGIRLLILPRCEKFLWTGGHEPEVQQVLTRILRPGMTFWDIGAHIGYFTLLASRLVGPSGSVHAFEPVPETFARLLASINANRADNVVAHEIALSSLTGTTSLHGSDLSILWSLEPAEGTTPITVQCQTLADAFVEHGAPQVIKVDAEGAEIDILASGNHEILDHGVIVLVETASDGDVDKAKKLLPSYDAERVNVNHWLLTKRPAADTRA